MEQNPYTFERYADKLQTAMKVEKLMNKDVADIFDVPPSYMSILNRDPRKVPTPFMEKIRAWDISNKPLRDYKLPTPADMLEAVPPETKEAAKEQASTAPAPEAPPLTKEEKKAKKAARLRELYERSKPPKRDPKPDAGKPPEPAGQPETPDSIIISRKGKTVDLSKISLRTGTTIFTAEVTENEIIIRFPLARQEVKK